jgi:hypothetical protein
MPLLGRDKARPRSRRSDDEFVVFLQGVSLNGVYQTNSMTNYHFRSHLIAAGKSSRISFAKLHCIFVKQ